VRSLAVLGISPAGSRFAHARKAAQVRFRPAPPEKVSVIAPKTVGRPIRFLLAILLLMALGGGGWYHRYHRIRKVPSSPMLQSQTARPIAAIALESARTQANNGPIESPSASEPQNKTPQVEISVHPMDQFREELRKALAQQLAPMYPQLPDLNRETANTVDAGYRDSVFQFLDAVEKTPAEKQPAMLLAADFMLQALWCPAEQKEQCDPLRNQFAAHKLTLAYSQLGGGWYYQHDLLWRVWQSSPATDWGERAFVLLLDSGWDTSSTCAKGSDQFREVIRQGEAFLQEHSHSSYRAVVIHIVGQAYATWWSLSNPPSAGVADYVDPTLYKDGSEPARFKAIASFEQVLQLSPGTGLGEYSRQVLPTLRAQQLTTDAYRFFCVYD
jgi:hypothetical protein